SHPARPVRRPNRTGGARPRQDDRRAARAVRRERAEPAERADSSVRGEAGSHAGARIVMTRDPFAPRLRDLNATAAAEAPPFGARLTQLRVAAGLSQVILAERAGLSSHAVSALERGARRVPQRATLAALVNALDLSAAEQAELERTVRRARD